ncbi:hypothetical protein KY346_05925 [Candidatus Woesearchaeota archaeon]|nr:hypothetical protein [Candidatus Woesearchaeota archaeon]
MKTGLLNRIKEFLMDLDKSIYYRRENANFDDQIALRIREDIEILLDGKALARFEREQDAKYKNTRRMYELHYCPLHFNPQFWNRKNQEKYFWLRLDIDEALDDSDYFYNA